MVPISAMTNMIFYRFLLILLLPIEVFGICSIFKGAQFTLGPEGYYSDRKKDGGTRQDGMLWGIRGRLDRISPCTVYLGAEGAFATGISKGHTGGGASIRSRMSDYQYEGRLGYTFPWTFGLCGTITPYLVYGQFVGVNDFLDPSPMTLRYRNSFRYGGAGIITKFQIGACLTAGFQASITPSSHPRSSISEDPFEDDITLIIEEKVQYVFEAPIQYKRCLCAGIFQAGITPFIRLRHYGGRENFPTDFFSTKFYIYGSRLDLSFGF